MPWAGSSMPGSGMQTWTPPMASTMPAEAREVDDDEVVDRDAGELLDLVHRAGRAADGEGLVPHHVGAAGDRVEVRVEALGPVDQRVARDADAVRALPVRREVQQDRGVGPLAAAGQVVDVVARGVAVVGAHHQDVERLLGTLDLLLHRPVDELLADVDDVEVAVVVAVEVERRQAGHQRQHDRRDEEHAADGVPLLDPAAPLRLAFRGVAGSRVAPSGASDSDTRRSLGYDEQDQASRRRRLPHGDVAFQRRTNSADRRYEPRAPTVTGCPAPKRHRLTPQ